MIQDGRHDALLQQEIATLRTENDRLKEENDLLKQINHVLRLKVDAMARKLFGRSSEKLDAAQLQMVFDALKSEADDGAKKDPASDSAACDSEAETAAADPEGNGKRKKRSFDEIVEGLPVTEEIIDPPEVKAHPEAWQCMGAEVTKLIDYIPGKFACQHIVRRKFVRKDARHLPPITAPLPTLQDRCIATPRLLAHTLTQRFELHLPYYRIERLYERQGVPLSRQTLCGWSGMCAD